MTATRYLDMPSFVSLSSGDEDYAVTQSPRQPTNQEFGIGSSMPFAVPYDGPRQGQETLYEAMRPLGEEQGPSVSQLEAMRRTDGQARALYRLITQPIRAALKNAKVISATAAEAAANGKQQMILTPVSTPPGSAPPPAKAPPGGGAPPRPGGQAALSEDDPDVIALAGDQGRAGPTAKASPTDTKGDGDDEALFIQQMLLLPPNGGGMVVPLKRMISQMLLGIFDGFSAFELVYWVPATGPLKGKVTLKKAAYRPANTVTFLTDDHGTFAGIRQRTFFQGQTIDVKIDAENTMYYAANEEERQFYGVSYFQTAFYHYDKKVKLYYVAHLAAQRAATGTRVGTMPKNAGTADVNNFQKALDFLGVGQYISLPGPDWKVEVLNDASTFDYMTYINHHNSQMSKSVLASFLDQSQGSGRGESTITSSRAGMMNQGMTDMFVAMLKAIMEDIADVINNQLIPKFIDWNYGSGMYPRFVWGTFTDDQSSAIRDTFDKLATAGTQSLVTPEFMRALEEFEAQEMGLDIDYDEVSKREVAEKAQADAMQAAIAAGGSLPGKLGGQAKPGMPGGGAPPPDAASAVASAKSKLNNSPIVGMTADDEAWLMQLASELLDAASVGG